MSSKLTRHPFSIMQKYFQIGRHKVLVTWKHVKCISLKVSKVTGEVSSSVPLHLSEQQTWEYLSSKEAWLDKYVEQAKQDMRDRLEEKPSISREEMCERLRTTLPPLLDKWADLMGVSFNRVILKEVKSYWGQCRPERGEIIFNIRLGSKPIEAIEYVVAHELLHLLIPGHGMYFNAAMDRIMPDWKKRRQMLMEL